VLVGWERLIDPPRRCGSASGLYLAADTVEAALDEVGFSGTTSGLPAAAGPAAAPPQRLLVKVCSRIPSIRHPRVLRDHGEGKGESPVYDAAGRCVRVLVDEDLDAGKAKPARRRLRWTDRLQRDAASELTSFAVCGGETAVRS